MNATFHRGLSGAPLLLRRSAVVTLAMARTDVIILVSAGHVRTRIGHDCGHGNRCFSPKNEGRTSGHFGRTWRNLLCELILKRILPVWGTPLCPDMTDDDLCARGCEGLEHHGNTKRAPFKHHGGSLLPIRGQASHRVSTRIGTGLPPRCSAFE